jgi:hypothetical protein
VSFFLTLILVFLSGCGQNGPTTTELPVLPYSPAAEVSGPGGPVRCFRDYRALPPYTSPKNYLSFPNFAVRGIGRCRGHAIIGQRMEMFARFEPGLPHPCLGLPAADCQRAMTTLISSALKGQIMAIGGFDSLFDFSQDPVARSILRQRIASFSHRYSAQDSPLASYQHPSTNLNVFHELPRRIHLRQRPYVGIEGRYSIGAHAVLAYQVRKLNDRQVICVRDPNIIIPSFPYEDCQNFFYTDGDSVYYRRHGIVPDEELWSLSLQTDEDQRVRHYIARHHEHCLQGRRSTKRPGF